MSTPKKGTKSEKKPKAFKPSQAKLPGFTNKDQDELEGVLEFYKTTEEKSKAKIKKITDEEEARIGKAALEVIKVMTKHGRKSINIGGLMGQILSVVKVKVKRHKGAKKEKKPVEGAKPKAPKKRPAPEGETVKSPPSTEAASSGAAAGQ